MRNASEVKKQKDILEEEFGWERMNEIFESDQGNGGSFNDLLSMEWDLNKTAVDDEIENTIGQLPKFQVSFDQYFDSNVGYKTGESNLSLNIPSTSDKAPAQNINKDNNPYKGIELGKNYEKEKELPRLLGLEITRDEYEKMKWNQYSDLRTENLLQNYAEPTS